MKYFTDFSTDQETIIDAVWDALVADDFGFGIHLMQVVGSLAQVLSPEELAYVCAAVTWRARSLDQLLNQNPFSDSSS